MIADYRGLFRSMSGRIGDFIVYNHRNRICVRSYPTNVKAPCTPGQLAQQARVASIAVFYHALKEAGVYEYWKKAAEGMTQSGYNLLVRCNLPAFDGEGRIGDFSKLQLSQGKVRQLSGLNLEEGTDGEWRLTWNGSIQWQFARKDDVVKLYVMEDGGEEFDVEPIETGECRRGDGECVFRLPERCKDFPHLYVLVCSRADGQCSSSRYFLLTHKF